jgi:hypothetical protein
VRWSDFYNTCAEFWIDLDIADDRDIPVDDRDCDRLADKRLVTDILWRDRNGSIS